MKEIGDFSNILSDLWDISECPNFNDEMRNKASDLRCYIKRYSKMDINDVMLEFRSLNGNSRASILHQALSFMESYNGRSQSYCIALSMGYEEDENGYWSKP